LLAKYLPPFLQLIPSRLFFYRWKFIPIWHCCLLLFVVTNNRVYNDAFRIFTFSMQQSLHDQKYQDNSFNFRFQIGNDRQSKRLLANLGRILFSLLLLLFFFFIKTGIQDFLLDIYSAYKSFINITEESVHKFIIHNMYCQSVRWLSKLPEINKLYY
jgi:hypothetical protein